MATFFKVTTKLTAANARTVLKTRRLCTWIYCRTISTTSENVHHEISARNKYIQWCLELFLFLWVFLWETPALLEWRTKLLYPRKPQHNRERCEFTSQQLSSINHFLDASSRIRKFWLCLKHFPELSPLQMRFLCWLLFPCLLLRDKMHLLGVFLKRAQAVSQLLAWQKNEVKILEGYSGWWTDCNSSRH